MSDDCAMTQKGRIKNHRIIEFKNLKEIFENFQYYSETQR